MKSESPLRLLLLLATLFGIAATAFTRPAAAEPRPGFGVEPTVQASWIAGLPLSFLENDAQLDPRVAFHVPGRDKQIYFTQKGITFLLTPGRKAAGRPVQSWAVKTTFLDADEDVRLHGLNPADVPLYRWKGARQGGEPDVDAAVAKAYQGIRYDGLWPAGHRPGADAGRQTAQVRVSRCARRRPEPNPLGLRRRRNKHHNGRRVTNCYPSGGFHRRVTLGLSAQRRYRATG